MSLESVQAMRSSFGMALERANTNSDDDDGTKDFRTSDESCGGDATANIGRTEGDEISQEDTHKKKDEQLSQIKANIQLLTSRVAEVEQRVCDLDDSKHFLQCAITKLPFELTELQMKLDEVENRYRRCNLRFMGIPDVRK
ncbi:hypothetical protein NDU88_004201 [Pleurodeles waltl]|uniref:Uncharacterized protein n=1 Tax=Pleurodeles waltl TaxID=8319 RepID=A0AAV7W4C5_PLEWA|nr:hypothetical protein NDU88_004201 [Pleurodeles waltl]